MNTWTSTRPLVSAAVLTGCAFVVILTGVVLLFWNWWASVPRWLTKTEYILSQAILVALLLSLIQLRVDGSVYVRIHVVVVLMALAGLVTLSGMVAFPGSSGIRYLACISSALAPLILLMVNRVE
jgi:hypothetical protein